MLFLDTFFENRIQKELELTEWQQKIEELNKEIEKVK